MKFEKPLFIKDTIIQEQLENVIIETGTENIYIKNKNKFIVDNNLLSDTPALFSYLPSLKTINFENFDFTNVKTMQSWFFNSGNLEEIIFPKKQIILKDFTSFHACFNHTSIRQIDLSNWDFNNCDVWFSTVFNECPHLKRVILPNNINYLSIVELFFGCSKLEEVIFGNCKIIKDGNNASWCFYHCSNLKKIDMSNVRNTNPEIKKILKSREALEKVSNDCLIILPNKKR